VFKRIRKQKRWHEILGLLLLLFLLYKVDSSNFKKASFYFKVQDIYFEYEAAEQIQKGINPYVAVLDSNMVENNNYATMLPLYYQFLGVLYKMADHEFRHFVELYRNILFIFHFLGGFTIYMFFRKLDKKMVGYTAAAIYMFNLWSLESFIFLKQDMIAIAFLLGSFYFFRGKKSWLSYLLLGISLGIKHIGIFALPLYLTPLLFKEKKLKPFLMDIFFLLIPIVLPAVPFLIDNFKGVAYSMLFSATRTAKYSKLIFGYHNLLVNYSDSGLNGKMPDFLLPRLPLLVATLMNVSLLFTKRITRAMYLLTSILVFTIFNPVIFPQYFTWIPPFIFAAHWEDLNKKRLS
jgi:hypothetical protein